MVKLAHSNEKENLLLSLDWSRGSVENAKVDWLLVARHELLESQTYLPMLTKEHGNRHVCVLHAVPNCISLYW